MLHFFLVYRHDIWSHYLISTLYFVLGGINHLIRQNWLYLIEKSLWHVLWRSLWKCNREGSFCNEKLDTLLIFRHFRQLVLSSADEIRHLIAIQDAISVALLFFRHRKQVFSWWCLLSTSSMKMSHTSLGTVNI